MRVLKIIALTLVAAILAVGITGAAAIFAKSKESDDLQASLQPFYTPPDPLPAGKPGDVIRYEINSNYDGTLNNAKAYRILYRSVGPDGSPRVSSGMVFIPTKPAKGERKVVAYAHGTTGFGDACAPSRNPATPAAQPWVQTMIDNGWVVTNTDYVGLGTPGDPYYLIGDSEAQDVVNSVRAARNFPGSQAGSEYVVMGHSQGGHSALWTGELSAKLAPELKLDAVVAGAPAAELAPLLSQQWDTTIAWALGPDVLFSWPQVYPNVRVDDVTTEQGAADYQKIAFQCMAQAGLTAQIKAAQGQYPFRVDPVSVPGWTEAVKEQTPPPLPAKMPVLVTQSTGDGVVLPNTTAVLQEKWCKAGSNLQMNWLGDIATGSLAPLLNHQDTLIVGWPSMVNWIEQRFRGDPPTPNCTVTPPVKPAK